MFNHRCSSVCRGRKVGIHFHVYIRAMLYTDCGWGAFAYTNSFVSGDILKTTGELGHNLNLIGTLVILRVSWALRTTVIVTAQYVTIQQRRSNSLEEAVVGYHHKLSKSVLRSGRSTIGICSTLTRDFKVLVI